MSDFDLSATAVPTHEEPVLVLSANSQEEADVARATLEASGIPAFLQNPNTQAGMSIVTENVDEANWVNGVYVPASHAETARIILNAPAPTEDELAAEVASDPTTLADAEAAVKNA